ncbi:MAG TPA: CinA family protein [Acidimicrobiia bacterium]|nr:CinA family protein [Acidimicrobiia bacterium]
MDVTATSDLFKHLVTRAQQTGVVIGAAESVTGGHFSFLMTRQPGAGEVFAGGLVTYQTEVKQRLLDVPEGPVVSHSAAEAMAVGARRLLDCDLVVSITGVAGPEPQDGQPVGRVFIGNVFGDEPVTSSRYDFAGDPDVIRHLATVAAARVALDRLSRLPTWPRSCDDSPPLR